MEIKNEYYKPRSLGTNNELDVIMDAILTQNSMAMDSAYVDDVCVQYAIVRYCVQSKHK